jgi:hypothetical protein
MPVHPPRVLRRRYEKSQKNQWPSIPSRHPQKLTATVAGTTARGVRLSEISAQKYASAIFGSCVIGDGAKPAFALKAKRLELLHQISHARLEILRRDDEADAPLYISRDQCGLFQVSQQHLTGSHRYPGREGERSDRGAARLGRPRRQRAFKPLEVPDARSAQGLEPLLDFEIGRVEQ